MRWRPRRVGFQRTGIYRWTAAPGRVAASATSVAVKRAITSGPVGKEGDAAKALRLALRKEAAAGHVKAAEFGILRGRDPGLHLQGEAVGHAGNDERVVRQAILLGRQLHAVQPQRTQYQRLAIQPQHGIRRRRRIAAQGKARGDDRGRRVELESQVDGVHQEVRRAVISAAGQSGVRSGFRQGRQAWHRASAAPAVRVRDRHSPGSRGGWSTLRGFPPERIPDAQPAINQHAVLQVLRPQRLAHRAGVPPLRSSHPRSKSHAARLISVRLRASPRSPAPHPAAPAPSPAQLVHVAPRQMQLAPRHNWPARSAPAR